MGDEERTERLAKIRADRLRRGGRPEPSEELLVRDVVASQALAGIDARAHLGLPADWQPGDPVRLERLDAGPEGNPWRGRRGARLTRLLLTREQNRCNGIASTLFTTYNYRQQHDTT